MRRKLLVTIIIGLTFISPAFAQFDGITPIGANTAQDLFGPALAGAGGFITSRGGAMASALNPAAEGEAQRIIFNAGYMALAGFGDEDGFGVGSAGLGAIFPTKYGVFGGSFWYINSPFDSFPVESYLQGNLNAAKELYPGMSFGLGLNVGYHFGDSLTVSGDLGFRYNMGTMGPFENFTWALTVKGLGKSWIPYAFTPAAGVALDVFRVRGKEGRADPLRMSFAADLMAPTFQNLAGKVGLSFLIADTINISGSSQFNLRESQNGNGPSSIPSIGISAIFKLKSGGQRIIGGALPSDGELEVDLAAKPLYNGIWTMGGGATWIVGVADKNPPAIILDYPQTAWISPNNDGKSDYLEFPISITDERYITEWVFEISDAYNEPVRVYRNKDIRPETQGVQNFLGRLRSVNTGVEVPESMRWDGTLDSGGIAQDGRYFFTVTAKDDNGNTSRKGPYEVNVDNTAPEIVLNPFAGEMNIFAPGSGGGRNTLTIAQTGSQEDLWEGGIYNSLGNKVKTFNFIDKPPTPIVWDGTDDSLSIVSDGVYSYRIAAADKAQNSTGASLENIIVNTVRPIVGLAITDAYFSPNGDGVKDTETLILTIPVKEGIASWELQVKDFSGNVRRGYSGASTIPERIEFDGRDNAGRLLGEAAYSASLSVHYRNGYLSTANSPVFNLDITSPSAAIQIEDRDQGPGRPAVFSPIGVKNRLVIIQEGTNEFSWTGEIRRDGDRSGTPVRTFRFSGTPTRRIEWDGINNAGALAPDGLYTYELYSTDLAGNSGRSNIVTFEIDTRDTPVFIATDLRSFSPNGDGIKDTINLIPTIQETSGILTWKIEIFNLGTAGAAGAVAVRSFEGRDQAPSSTVWNGRTNAGTLAPDGNYVARLDLEYRSGNRPTSLSMAFNLRTAPPQGDISVPYYIFAPNGNGNRDTLPVRVTTEGNDEWNLVVSSGDNTAVRSWNWTGRAPAVSIVWDGKDEAGNVVNDGTYNITLSSTDDAGNSARKNINNIIVDANVPKIFLTASAQAIAPKPGQTEAMRFNILATPAEGVTFWKLELRDDNNGLIKSFPSQAGGTGPLPTVLPWNGANERNEIIEGRVTPSLTVNYEKGDVVNVSAPPITVDISGPVLGFHSQPEFFSPDNDGVDDELFIFLSARDFSPIAEWSLEIRETEGTNQVFYRIGGRGSPSDRIIWDGRSNWGELVQSASDYEYTYSARDTLGNASSITGKITTDVLVIRDGDILRILIPSITFRANYADFIGIPKERQETNTRVLKRIAEILNKFRDYRIIVEGHANPVLRTAKEEDEVLKPLSLARAQFVIEHLVSYGVSRNRLSSTGQGGTRNVANSQDPNNNWKNRRVEFLLIK
jgi:flagellar hook assembly protein FlgD/outer membrane protein OmpA-like peptidoglycan-associated protein